MTLLRLRAQSFDSRFCLQAAVLFCLVLLLPVASAGAEAVAKRPAKTAVRSHLAAQIDAILAEPAAARAHWGISVTGLDGKPIYAHDAAQLHTPASNTKLFTTTAAMALLGPDYRYKTTVESTAPVDAEGRVNGDLLLIGRGDPNLSGRVIPYSVKTDRTTPSLKVLEDLADAVAKTGVKTVTGNLIADDSYFIQEPYGEGWAYDDVMWEYGAPASALSVNDNQIFLNVLPGQKPGDLADYTLEPPYDYYVIDNSVTTTVAGTKRNIGMDRRPGSRVITLWGTIPLDDKGLNAGLAIEDPTEYAGIAFRHMLEDRGILIQGQTREHHSRPQDFAPAQPNPLGGPALPIPQPTPLPTPGYVLAQRLSNPLIDDLKVINKVSQNLHVEILLRTLGKERGGSGSIEGGVDVLRKFLESVGIPHDAFVFYDGSGVSRSNLVTPEAITTLLCYVARQPWAAQFRDTLPVGGVDGTLTGRFKGTSLEGKVQAKTGTETGVSTLGGFVQTRSGHWLAFSIMVDDHLLPSNGRQYIDRILRAIAQQ